MDTYTTYKAGMKCLNGKPAYYAQNPQLGVFVLGDEEEKVYADLLEEIRLRAVIVRDNEPDKNLIMKKIGQETKAEAAELVATHWHNLEKILVEEK